MLWALLGSLSMNRWRSLVFSMDLIGSMTLSLLSFRARSPSSLNQTSTMLCQKFKASIPSFSRMKITPSSLHTWCSIHTSTRTFRNSSRLLQVTTLNSEEEAYLVTSEAVEDIQQEAEASPNISQHQRTLVIGLHVRYVVILVIPHSSVTIGLTIITRAMRPSLPWGLLMRMERSGTLTPEQRLTSPLPLRIYKMRSPMKEMMQLWLVTEHTFLLLMLEPLTSLLVHVQFL